MINQFSQCYLDNCANDIDHSLTSSDSHSLFTEVINSSLILRTNNDTNQMSVGVPRSGLDFWALMTVASTTESPQTNVEAFIQERECSTCESANH